MYGLANDLVQKSENQLAVATVYDGSQMKSFLVNDIQYYLIPKASEKLLAKFWLNIVDEWKPDLVHVHGTEYSHGMSLMRASPDFKFVISIQGLVSVCHRYFMGGMSNWDVFKNISLRDLVRRNTLFDARRDFYRRGKVELEYIRRASAVIGRTEWDRAHSKAICSTTPYHFCNESLRDEFYFGERWSIDTCRKHSIFLSQAATPIKGIHQVLKAVALLKIDFPDIKVTVAGHDITKTTSLKDRVKRSGYGRFVAHLIRRYQLQSHVVFLGTLPPEGMKKAYLASHVFVCPSSIENSPNSLGEAQLLGVPCVAAYVGGIPSMVSDDRAVKFYPFEEFEMLAEIIRGVFEDDCLANSLAASGYADAVKRHDRNNNLQQLISIYNHVELNEI